MGSINQSVVSNDTDGHKNLWFDDEDTTESFENNLSSRGQSSNTPASKRPVRNKPNRVTIFSLPSNTSTSTLTDSTLIFNFHRTNQRPYYQQGKIDASIRRVDWRL
jgi:membrane-bound lytic murein transglycosylase B